MRVVVALGGNALLKRGEPMTAKVQRKNVKVAAQALAPVGKEHQLVLSHGNGPQVEAPCAFVRHTGKQAAIGSLADIEAIVAGEAGTIVANV